MEKPEEEAYKLLELAEAQFERGDFAGAVSLGEAAHTTYPSLPCLRHALAAYRDHSAAAPQDAEPSSNQPIQEIDVRAPCFAGTFYAGDPAIADIHDLCSLGIDATTTQAFDGNCPKCKAGLGCTIDIPTTYSYYLCSMVSQCSRCRSWLRTTYTSEIMDSWVRSTYTTEIMESEFSSPSPREEE